MPTPCYMLDAVIDWENQQTVRLAVTDLICIFWNKAE